MTLHVLAIDLTLTAFFVVGPIFAAVTAPASDPLPNEKERERAREVIRLHDPVFPLDCRRKQEQRIQDRKALLLLPVLGRERADAASGRRCLAQSQKIKFPVKIRSD